MFFIMTPCGLVGVYPLSTFFSFLL